METKTIAMVVVGAACLGAVGYFLYNHFKTVELPGGGTATLPQIKNEAAAAGMSASQTSAILSAASSLPTSVPRPRGGVSNVQIKNPALRTR